VSSVERLREPLSFLPDPFFSEGFTAALNGNDLGDCPYDEGTDGREGWVTGWRFCCVSQRMDSLRT
jgi:ribosome modulation factor